MAEIIHFFLHFDVHLAELVTTYGAWIYAILFVIIFAETGLVVTPILPAIRSGFPAARWRPPACWTPGSRRACRSRPPSRRRGDDAVGNYAAPKIFSAEDRAGLLHRLLNKDHLRQAHAFFERHGGKAIVLGRFVPIVRTFVPFVAGAGEMTYASFAFYNVTGAFIWVGLCVGLGYAFGNVPVVKENFSLVALGIVFVSMLPMVYELLQRRRGPSGAA